jgi:hypothetical protein
MSNLYLGTRQAEKAIIRSAKRVIATRGLVLSTKSGSKELKRVVKKLSTAEPCKSLDIATSLGEALGDKVVALSQKLGKKNLDRGVLLAISIPGDLPSIDSLPSEGLATKGSVQTGNAERSSGKSEALEKTPELKGQKLTTSSVLASKEAESNENSLGGAELPGGPSDILPKTAKSATFEPQEDVNKAKESVKDRVNATVETFEETDQTNEVETILESNVEESHVEAETEELEEELIEDKDEVDFEEIQLKSK